MSSLITPASSTKSLNLIRTYYKKYTYQKPKRREVEILGDKSAGNCPFFDVISTHAVNCDGQNSPASAVMADAALPGFKALKVRADATRISTNDAACFL